MTAFRATYSDWKLVKTRGVVQVVMEVPLAESDAAYEVLGGMPVHGKERWFGIAAINLGKEAMPNPPLPELDARPQPSQPQAGAKRGVRPWREMKPSSQAGTLCNEAVFHAFLFENYGFDVTGTDQAAIVVRQLCKVESRREFDTDPDAKVRWQGLDDQYQAWKALEHA